MDQTVRGGAAAARQGDRPALPIDESVGWGSDVAAQMLRRLEIPYIVLNPGASYRGLHDSLVNHLGNRMPEMLMCLHEEHAVAIAHGYAKASGRPLAVALHSNVGLMHGAMAIFNAWCDRQPMLVLGATGPLDAAARRPWIDWIHTAQDQAALIRAFIKWDDQPGSAEAVPEAILRGWQIARTAPTGPVYVCLDAGVQEGPAPADFAFPDPARHAAPEPSRPGAAALAAAAEAIMAAERPVILFGRGARTEAAWAARVALAERTGAAMFSDLKSGAMVPTDHPQHAVPPFNKLPRRGTDILKAADLILSLGWMDLGGLLGEAFGAAGPACPVIHAGQDVHLHHGFGKEHAALAPVDIALLGDPDCAVADLLAALPEKASMPWTDILPAEAAQSPGEALTLDTVAASLADAAAGTPVTFAALARGWPVGLWPHRHPLDYLGKDGGGGVGSGPGLTIGAALALRDSGRITVGVLGDGDTLMSINALWTAARYGIPALIIVANNRSYYNDELHQERVAIRRGRNPANRWIGQAIDGPAPDIAGLARAQGVEAVGPVADGAALDAALRAGVAAVRAGRPFLVDVHIDGSHRRDMSEAGADRPLGSEAGQSA